MDCGGGSSCGGRTEVRRGTAGEERGGVATGETGAPGQAPDNRSVASRTESLGDHSWA